MHLHRIEGSTFINPKYFVSQIKNWKSLAQKPTEDDPNHSVRNLHMEVVNIDNGQIADQTMSRQWEIQGSLTTSHQ